MCLWQLLFLDPLSKLDISIKYLSWEPLREQIPYIHLRLPIQSHLWRDLTVNKGTLERLNLVMTTLSNFYLHVQFLILSSQEVVFYNLKNSLYFCILPTFPLNIFQVYCLLFYLIFCRMTFSSSIMTKDLVEISWDTPGHLLFGTEHR